MTQGGYGLFSSELIKSYSDPASRQAGSLLMKFTSGHSLDVTQKGIGAFDSFCHDLIKVGP